MQQKSSSLGARSLASLLAVGALVAAGDATAQPGGPRPPPGTFAVPPPGAEMPGAIYDRQSQLWDRDHAERRAEWAARNCVSQRRNNAGPGAVFGGVMGAIIGSNVAGSGSRGAGAVAGGALGAMAGAAIGSNTSSGSAIGSDACPPGFVVRAGAPNFRLGPGFSAAVVSGPSWYNPWFWTGDRWVFRPYRYWWWNNQSFWQPGWRHGRWSYNYRRW